MNSIQNPFLIKGYITKELFCDREDELKELLRNIRNGIDTTLISPRRMGKTGLILRFFEHLTENEPEVISLYTDIYASRSLSDFVKLSAEAILKKFKLKTKIGSNFMLLLRSLRPLISYDAITGEPQIQIAYQSPQEKEHTLKSLLQFIDEQGKQIVFAIDEFQQITKYPEKNIEALLRTYTQQLKNIRFIYCGSNKTMMVNIFSSAKSPFYSSTRYINPDKIDAGKYAFFIRSTFKRNGIDIEEDALEFILQWSKRHTYYTQSLCNMTFSIAQKTVNTETVKDACFQLLKQYEPVFLQYRQMLTPQQWNYLIAIAKEDEVVQITSQNFISKHNIGTPANSRRLCNSLVSKDLILTVQDKNQKTYMVYDVFFSRWLQREY